MSRDLTNLFIDETFQFLTQISGSNQDILLDGVGNQITELQVTASHATSASYATTASYALNVPAFDTGSLLVTASAADATITFTKGDSSTFDVTVNNITDALYAQNTVTTGKSLEATTILKGTPLYFTGSGTSGNLVGVYIADAGNPDRMPAGGVAGVDIDPGEEGLILLDGYIGGVNTSIFASGDEVFVAVGGGYTNVAPTGSSNLIQHLGNVEKSAINGSGVIQMMGEPRGLPNVQSGYVWVGDANDVPQAVATGSLSVSSAVSSSQAENANTATSASYALTASYAENSIPAFPFTGSALITGSLGITGSLNVDSVDNIILESQVEILQQVNGVQAKVNQFAVNYQKLDSGSISMFFNAFNGQSQPTVYFAGDNSYFQATGNMSFENAPGGQGSGSMDFRTNGNLTFTTPNYGVDQNGGNILFQANSGSIDLQTGGDIDIQGKAFAYSITSNINGFSNEVGEATFVRDNQRAFVETPLIIGTNGSVTVGTNSTLKVINEL